ncbi:TPM domain-containing protein [Parasphingopyxis sp.]|uniref:TPM domain-containing protein n=1 Tax=Parasphingopyxis sp. TaxID=1920299 RepID=UPI00262A40EA|nr:TPM domain-containing protein [Parasphingopyxis sp.]
MKKTAKLMIGAAGLSMALTACSGGEDVAEATEEEAAEEEAVEAPEEFIIDQTGQLGDELGDTMAAVNTRLGEHFAETGDNVQILIVETTEGGDIGEAATTAMGDAGSNAMIYIAAGDQRIGVVGTGIDTGEGEQIAADMADAFDNEDFDGGFMNAIDATAAAMSN